MTNKLKVFCTDHGRWRAGLQVAGPNDYIDATGPVETMRAREAIHQSSFDPRDLATITVAFDEAWSAVANSFSTALAKKAARLVLANAMLACATRGGLEPTMLKRAGLTALAERYPRRVTRSSPAYLVMLVDQNRATIARSQNDIGRLWNSIHRADAAIRKSMALLRVGSRAL